VAASEGAAFKQLHLWDWGQGPQERQYCETCNTTRQVGIAMFFAWRRTIACRSYIAKRL